MVSKMMHQTGYLHNLIMLDANLRFFDILTFPSDASHMSRNSRIVDEGVRGSYDINKISTRC